MKIRHTGIVVSDIDKALHFYNKLLGLEIVKDMWESGEFIDNILGFQKVKVRTVKMDAGGSLVELLCFKSLHPRVSFVRNLNLLGCTHIALTVDNLDKYYNLLKEDGIRFVSEPQKSEDGSVKVAFCKDPDETFVELVEEL